MESEDNTTYPRIDTDDSDEGEDPSEKREEISQTECCSGGQQTYSAEKWSISCEFENTQINYISEY